jgi:hypothetical protein
MRMKWRSREPAEELVTEFEASGLSRKQFCEQRGRFTKWDDSDRRGLRCRLWFKQSRLRTSEHKIRNDANCYLLGSAVWPASKDRPER